LRFGMFLEKKKKEPLHGETEFVKPNDLILGLMKSKRPRVQRNSFLRPGVRAFPQKPEGLFLRHLTEFQKEGAVFFGTY